MFSFIRAASIHKSRELLNGNFSKLRKKFKNVLCLGSCGMYGQYQSHHAPSSVEEVTIPIPYGHLAAKVWGKDNSKPILALHGWMDNCGTFDKLIPLLENSPYVVALDFPGHGFSSHKPPGCFYDYSDMYIAAQQVRRHFNWKSFSIIGHSMGVEIAQIYAGLYPENVEKIIALDTIKPISQTGKNMPKKMAEVIITNLSLEEKLKGDVPVYNAELIFERLIKGMHNEITPRSAEILLKRGAKPSPCGKGQVFTRDLRLRTVEFFNAFSDEVIREIMSRISCEMLILQAKNPSPRFTSPTPEFDLTFLDIYRKNCKSFEFVTVDGNHFIHLNNPEQVAPLINKFLSNV